MYATTCRGKAAMAATTTKADMAMRMPRRMSILSKEARYESSINTHFVVRRYRCNNNTGSPDEGQAFLVRFVEILH